MHEVSLIQNIQHRLYLILFYWQLGHFLDSFPIQLFFTLSNRAPQQWTQLLLHFGDLLGRQAQLVGYLLEDPGGKLFHTLHF